MNKLFFLQSAPSVASCGVSSGAKATKRRMRMKSRRKSWRTTTGGPNTALKASWETDVSALLHFFLVADVLVGKNIVGIKLQMGLSLP